MDLSAFAVFGSIVAIVYIIARKKERMTLIQKGLDINLLDNKKKNKLISLKYGLLCISIGLAILLGKIFVAANILEEEVAYFSMIFLLGGISLLSFYFIEKKMNNEEKS